MSKAKKPSTSKVKPPKAKVNTGQKDSVKTATISAQPAAGAEDMTVARMLGEITWVMTQSGGHKLFPLVIQP